MAKYLSIWPFVQVFDFSYFELWNIAVGIPFKVICVHCTHSTIGIVTVVVSLHIRCLVFRCVLEYINLFLKNLPAYIKILKTGG